MSGVPAVAKRRISANKTNLALPVAQIDDDDDDVRSVTSASSRRRSLGGRRRSSFGSHASKTVVSAVEQNRIAEMYKTVIKMSSENKITMKNSWSYDLIDHMGNLIRDESTGQRGINFQKASCTLDASVKIYSNRVDDTHGSSIRILQSLSRTYADDDGEGQARGAAEVGSKNKSNKLNIAETIEKDVDNINAPKVETLQAADPMFHKMSKAFDDGGAKGMLMTNLRVSQTECALVFATAQRQEDEEEATTAAAVAAPAETTAGGPAVNTCGGIVDVSDLIFKCGFDAQSLLSLTVCPALEDYRRTIGISETTAGAFDLNDYPAYFPPVSVGPPSQAAEGAVVLTSAGAPLGPVAAGGVGAYDDVGFDGPDAYADDGDDGDNDYGGNDNDFPSNDDDGDAQYTGASASSRNTLEAAVARRKTLDAESHKMQWLAEAPATADADAGAVSSEVDAAAAADAVVWDSAGITSTNDYSFFDLEAISKSNSWAGARHWKYATRKTAALDRVARLPAAAEEDEHEEAGAGAEEGKDGNALAAGGEEKKGTKKGDKKEKDKFVFDFRCGFVGEDAFAVPAAKSRGGDVTCLTAAALEKDAAAGAEGVLFLPPDAKLQTSDMCRLMMCGNIIVPPPMLAHAFIKQVNAAAASSSSRPAQRAVRTGLYSSSVQGPDVIWGQVRKVAAPAGSTFAGQFGQAAPSWGHDNDVDDDHDDHDGGDFGEDFCDGDNDYDGPAANNTASQPEPEGLYINTAALLRAPRLVEKIDIGFATTAKRVNVKKLKTDIWSHIDELPVASTTEDGENQSPNAGTEAEAAGGKATDKLSFQDLVREIATEQKQKDVTLPFYFICLLHLANEKTLKIEGSPFMDNLVISKDMKI